MDSDLSEKFDVKMGMQKGFMSFPFCSCGTSLNWQEMVC